MSFEQILDEEVTILFKIEGEGTRLLADFPVGSRIGVQGPLGNGFPVDRSFDRHILVAGGIGVAPFPALAKSLRALGVDRLEVVIAARNGASILCEDLFEALGCEVHIATDDGSRGAKAFACDQLAKLNPSAGTRVYACGPMVMMKTTSEVAVQAGADCQVALEAQMACGDGACLGCVVESKFEQEGEEMVRVCCDGPVFDTTIIDWDAHNLAYDPGHGSSDDPGRI